MKSIEQSKLPLWMVILIFYVVTSLGSLLLGIIQSMLGVPAVVIQLTQFGPALGVLALFLLRSRVKLPVFDIQFGPRQPQKLIAIFALTAGVFAAAWLWYSFTGHTVTYTSPSSLSYPFWVIVIAQWIGAAGEEIGWRCFLQPVLQSRFGVLLSSIIVGILWGVWHIGIFAEGWEYAILFIVFAVALSVILGELLRKARGGKLLLSASMHALMNLGLLVWFNEEEGNLMAIGTLAASCVLSAFLVVVLGKIRDSSRNKWSSASS